MPKQILMPALSPTMQSGNLGKWLVDEGQQINAGDVIAEIETDKSVMELESPFTGTIHKFLMKQGTRDIAVNTAIAILLEEGENAGDVTAENPKDEPKTKAVDTRKTAPPVSAATPRNNSVAQHDSDEGGRIKISPVAKKIAQENNINLNNIKGTGPNNRIIKTDVMAIKSSPPPPCSASSRVTYSLENEFETITASNMRRVIAAKLIESKTTVPHFYLEISCVIDDLLKTREELNAELQSRDEPKLTVNDFIVKASALAIGKNKDMNSSWQQESIIKYKNINICVAVAIDGGLVTPVIRNVDKRSLSDISRDIKEMAAKARQGKIMPEDLQGGTFTISNLGMYDISGFSAIINPPQSAIMAVGAGKPQPVVRGGEIKIANVMNITLSVDHRVVDGALGARFLASFKTYIEKPALMLI